MDLKCAECRVTVGIGPEPGMPIRCSRCGEMNTLRATVSRLERELATERQSHAHTVNCYKVVKEALATERAAREKAEGALREIVAELGECNPPCETIPAKKCGECHHAEPARWCASCVARRALAPSPVAPAGEPPTIDLMAELRKSLVNDPVNVAKREKEHAREAVLLAALNKIALCAADAIDGQPEAAARHNAVTNAHDAYNWATEAIARARSGCGR